MNQIIEKILEHIPVAEIVARHIFDGKKGKAVIKKKLKQVENTEKKVSLERFEEMLKEIGIRERDIVIVHSSMDGMKCLEATPVQIIEVLQKIVGKEGTIVFPVFPYQLLRNEEGLIEYNIRNSKIWTGLLPYVFLKMQGTIRSKFPVNSLAANGKYAEEMMKFELESDLPHGSKSAWGFCMENKAKVLYLGVRVRQADTILHVAEDYMDEEWPIKDWYSTGDYLVKDGKEDITRISVRSRSGKWHKYFASFYSGYVLEKESLIQSQKCENLVIELIPNSKQFVEFVIQRAKDKKTFYFVPQKYIKR